MPDEFNLDSGLIDSPAPRRRSGLRPELESHWNNLRTELESAGERPVIRSGFRTAEQQNALHRRGLPTKGNDGYINISPHQEGRALDLGNLSRRGQRIVADYARRNALHVPGDEPWHIALPKSQQGSANISAGLNTDDPLNLNSGLEESAPTKSVAVPRVERKRSPDAFQKALAEARQAQAKQQASRVPETIEAGEGYSTPSGLLNQPSPVRSMQARKRGLVERAKEAIAPYVPGLTSIDSPMGIKTDPIRGFARGASLGLIGDRREITPEELIANPRAEADQSVSEFGGETIGAVLPYVAAGKALSLIPALSRATRTAHIARNAATFGGVEAAREGIHTARTGEPIDPANIAVSTAIGAAMGGIAGVDPSMKRQVVAFLTPGIVADVARGAPLEQSVQSALTNLGFALTSGARGKRNLSAKQIGEIRERIKDAKNANVASREGRSSLRTVAPDLTERTNREGETIRRGTEEGSTRATQRPLESELERVINARQAETQRQGGATAQPAKAQTPVQPELVNPQQQAGARSEVSSSVEQPQRFQHLQFGEVEVLPDQANAGRGRLRVAEVNNPEAIHYVKKASMLGRGNQRMIPLKERAIEPAVEDASRVESRAKKPFNMKEVWQEGRRQHVIDSLAKDEIPYKGWDKDYPDIAAQRRAEVGQPAEPATAAPAEPPKPSAGDVSTAIERPLQPERAEPLVNEAKPSQLPVQGSERQVVEPSIREGTRTTLDDLKAEFKAADDNQARVYADSTTSVDQHRAARARLDKVVSELEQRGVNITELAKERRRQPKPSSQGEVVKPKTEGELSKGPAGQFTESRKVERPAIAGEEGALNVKNAERVVGLPEQPTIPRIMPISRSLNRASTVIGAPERQAMGEAQRGKTSPVVLKSHEVNAAWDRYQSQFADAGPASVQRVKGIEVRKVGAIPDFVELRGKLREGEAAHGWTSDTSRGPLVFLRGNLTREQFDTALRHEFDHINTKDFRAFDQEYPGRAVEQPSSSKVASPKTLTAKKPLVPETKTSSPAVAASEGKGAGQGAEKPAPSFTAAKREKVTSDRAERDLPPIRRPERKPDEVLLESAKEANKADPAKPLRLAEEVLNKPRALSDKETVQLDLRQQELKNEYDRVAKEITDAKDTETIQRKGAESDAIESEMQRLEEAWAASGTEKGRALRSQRIAIDQDFRLLTMISKAKKARGRELRPEERQKIETQAKEIESLTQKLTEAEGRAKTAGLQKEIDRVSRQRRRAETKVTLDQEAVVIKQNILAEIARLKAQASNVASLSGLGSLDPEGVITREVRKYIHNRAKATVRLKAEALVDEVHSIIGDLGLNKRDVRDLISGYSIAPKSTRSELQKRLDAIRSELHSLSKTEDVEAGVRSARREGPKQSEARRLPAVGPRKSESRSSGIPLQGPKRSDVNKVPAQGPRQSEARQSGIPIQGPRLSDVRRVLAEGPKLSEIRRSGRKVEGPKEVPIGPPREIFNRNQARQKALLKEEAELQRRIAEGDFSEKPKRKPPRYTRETYRLQKQVDELKIQYNKDLYRATRSVGGKISDELAKAANVPKTLKSIGDISAVFRQGGFYAVTHPIEGGVKPFKEMVKSFSGLGWRNVEAKIKADADFETLRKAGVEFTGVDKNDPRLSRHEEGYLGKEYLDYIPIAKQVAGFSERTFVSFLDAQRLSMGKQMLDALTPAQRKSATELKAIARLINTGTGRGSLGRRGNAVAPALNIAMFSPRLLASRIQLLNNMINPVTIARMPAGARARMIKDNVKFIGAVTIILSLAKASGATVSLDPDDSEFLKIRFGNTVYDTLTGLQQPMRYIINMARAATGGETYAGQDMAEQTKRFARSKLNPALAPAVNYVSGEDFMGRKFSAKREAIDLVTPLPAKDVVEAFQQEGLLGALKATPTFVGVGIGSYPPPLEKPEFNAHKLARKFIKERMPDRARTEEEVEKSKQVSEIRARSRRGEDVTAEVQGLPKRQAGAILEAKNNTRWQEDFKRLTLKEAIIVYKDAPRDKQAEVRDIFAEKADRAIPNLSEADQEEVKKDLASLGMLETEGRRPRQREVRKPRSRRRQSYYQFAP